jgi:pyridinium-3,5-biscarboxylic acid mononucleotide synthase
MHAPRVTLTEAKGLLERFKQGETRLEEVLHAFQAAPIADLGFAQVDLHRSLRKNFPEVIYGENKTPEQVTAIALEIAEREQRLLITRITEGHSKALRKKLKPLKYHAAARCITYEKKPLPKRPGKIAVLAAGTSDLPVAEEAAITADVMGNTVVRMYDVGVAGLHRLLRRMKAIQEATVIIAVAGMEGALPSVVAGLVNKPVIGVPTNVGYGTSFGGLAALFAMLNSCGSGLTVVNINNGFGAGFAASQINALAAGELE